MATRVPEGSKPAEDRADSPREFSDAEKSYMESYVRSSLVNWFKIIGLANAAVVLSFFVFVFTVLPSQVANFIEDDAEIESKILDLSVQYGTRLGELNQLSIQKGELQSNIEDLAASVDTLENGNVARASRLIDALGDSSSIEDIAVRIDEAEESISQLGADRSNVVSLKVNNPNISGPDRAVCPEGTFISAIRASRGVGGRYATDGISELTLECTPVSAQTGGAGV